MEQLNDLSMGARPKLHQIVTVYDAPPQRTVEPLDKEGRNELRMDELLVGSRPPTIKWPT